MDHFIVLKDLAIEKIWKFIRGDLSVKEFEEWIYSDDIVENLFGESLYLEIISANYLDKESIYQIKQLLTEFVRQFYPLKCKCLELSDNAIVDMDAECDKVFKNLIEVKKRGEKYWWLSVYQCGKCNQVWLVASEERQNDIYCFRRLKNQTLTEIIEKNHWPPYFDKYETLLKIGLEGGRSVRFVDPFESSLLWTIEDLALERPGISVSEIAQLLNLDIELAKELSKIAIKDEKVQILFK